MSLDECIDIISEDYDDDFEFISKKDDKFLTCEKNTEREELFLHSYKSVVNFKAIDELVDTMKKTR